MADCGSWYITSECCTESTPFIRSTAENVTDLVKYKEIRCKTEMFRFVTSNWDRRKIKWWQKITAVEPSACSTWNVLLTHILKTLSVRSSPASVWLVNIGGAVQDGLQLLNTPHMTSDLFMSAPLPLHKLCFKYSLTRQSKPFSWLEQTLVAIVLQFLPTMNKSWLFSIAHRIHYSSYMWLAFRFTVLVNLCLFFMEIAS